MSDPGTAVKLGMLGLSLANSLSGSSKQQQQQFINNILMQQLAQNRLMGMNLGRIGVPSNPFSAQYGSIFSDPTGLQNQATRANLQQGDPQFYDVLSTIMGKMGKKLR
jgi:hypothetical protein